MNYYGNLSFVPILGAARNFTLISPYSLLSPYSIISSILYFPPFFTFHTFFPLPLFHAFFYSLFPPIFSNIVSILLFKHSHSFFIWSWISLNSFLKLERRVSYLLSIAFSKWSTEIISISFSRSLGSLLSSIVSNSLPKYSKSKTLLYIVFFRWGNSVWNLSSLTLKNGMWFILFSRWITNWA